MSDIEKRLKKIEDRFALEEVLQNYYAAVDSMHDVDGIIDCFVEDGVFDLSGLGLSRLEGHAAIRAFFEGVFKDTANHSHHVSNFRVKSLGENDATARGYVIGKAEGKAGEQVLVYCYYNIEYRRTAQGWKMTLFDEGALIPFGSQIDELHGDH